VILGARNRVRTRHNQLVDVLGLSVMAAFACWQAGAPGDSALSRLPPPGTEVLIHEEPDVLVTWDPHAVEGWYQGPATFHYQ
jgi:hypothetical protein